MHAKHKTPVNRFDASPETVSGYRNICPVDYRDIANVGNSDLLLFLFIWKLFL